MRPRVRLLVDGKPFAGDPDWHLNPGDLVVTDESAMTNTPDIVPSTTPAAVSR